MANLAVKVKVQPDTSQQAVESFKHELEKITENLQVKIQVVPVGANGKSGAGGAAAAIKKDVDEVQKSIDQSIKAYSNFVNKFDLTRTKLNGDKYIGLQVDSKDARAYATAIGNIVQMQKTYVSVLQDVNTTEDQKAQAQSDLEESLQRTSALYAKLTHEMQIWDQQTINNTQHQRALDAETRAETKDRESNAKILTKQTESLQRYVSQYEQLSQLIRTNNSQNVTLFDESGNVVSAEQYLNIIKQEIDSTNQLVAAQGSGALSADTLAANQQNVATAIESVSAKMRNLSTALNQISVQTNNIATLESQFSDIERVLNTSTKYNNGGFFGGFWGGGEQVQSIKDAITAAREMQAQLDSGTLTEQQYAQVQEQLAMQLNNIKSQMDALITTQKEFDANYKLLQESERAYNAYLKEQADASKKAATETKAHEAAVEAQSRAVLAANSNLDNYKNKLERISTLKISGDQSAFMNYSSGGVSGSDLFEVAQDLIGKYDALTNKLQYLDAESAAYSETLKELNSTQAAISKAFSELTYRVDLYNKAYRDAQKDLADIDKAERQHQKELEASKKKQEQEANAFKAAYKSKSDQIKNYANQIEAIFSKLNGGQGGAGAFNYSRITDTAMQAKVDALKQSMKELQTLMTSFNNGQGQFGTQDQMTAAFDKILDKFNEIKLAKTQLDDELRSDKGFKQFQERVDMTIHRQTRLVQAFNGFSGSKFEAEFIELTRQLKNGEIEIGQYTRAVDTLRDHMTQAGMQANTFVNITDRLGKMMAMRLQGFVLMQFTRAVRDSMNMIREFDTELGQFQIVTRSSDQQMAAFGERILDISKKIRVSARDVTNAATVYARLGYTAEESLSLSSLTTKFSKVAYVGVEEAEDNLTAIIKAFNVNIDDVESVLDKVVTVGNNFPISAAGIGEGMQNASSALAAAGNSLEESMAMLQAANTTAQNAARSSTALRTIAARIRSANASSAEEARTELTELGENIEGLEEATLAYQKDLDNYTGGLVQITDANGELRTTYEILNDLASVWGKLGSQARAVITKDLAGTRQQDIFLSLMANWNSVNEAIKEQETAVGSLSKGYDIAMDTIEGRLGGLSTSWESLVNHFVDNDIIKGFISLLTDVIKTFDLLLEEAQPAVMAITTLGGAILANRVAIPFVIGAFKTLAGTLGGVAASANMASGALSFLGGPTTAMIYASFALFGLLSSAIKQNIRETEEAFNKAKEVASKQEETSKKLQDAYTSLRTIDTENAKIEDIESALDTVGLKLDEQLKKQNNINKAREEGLRLLEEEAKKSAEEFTASQINQTNKINAENWLKETSDQNVNFGLFGIQYSKGYNGTPEERLKAMKGTLAELNSQTDTLTDKQMQEVEALDKATAELEQQIQDRKDIVQTYNDQKAIVEGTRNPIKLDAADFYKDNSSQISSFTDAYHRYTDAVVSADAAIAKLSDAQKQYGNVNNVVRQGIVWTAEELEKYKDLIDNNNWGLGLNGTGDFSSALGTSSNIGGKEIAFTPILQTDHGPELLTEKNVSDYLSQVINAASEMEGGLTAENILAIDASGIYSDELGMQIQGLIAAVQGQVIDGIELTAGNVMEIAGASAEEITEILGEEYEHQFASMHEIQEKTITENQIYWNELSEMAAAAGKETVSEYIDSMLEAVYSADLKNVFEQLNSQMDELQTAYKSLTEVATEYNENKALDFDTLQTLLGLDSQYIEMLQFEDGQLKVNAQTLSLLAQQRIDDAKAAVAEQTIQELNAIAAANEAQENVAAIGIIGEKSKALAVLSGSYDYVTDSAIDAYKAQALADAYFNAYNKNAGETQKVMNNFQTKMKLIDSVQGQLTKSTSGLANTLGGYSGAASSASKATDDLKDSLNNETEALEKQLDLLKDEEKELDRINDKLKIWGQAMVDALKKQKDALSQQIKDEEDYLKLYGEAAIEAAQRHIDELEAQKKAQDELNDAREKEIALAQAKAALAAAQANKNVRVYTNDGWQWVADANAVKQAQDKVDELEFDNAKDAADAAIETEIDKWKKVIEYYKEYKSLVGTDYEEYKTQQELVAQLVEDTYGQLIDKSYSYKDNVINNMTDARRQQVEDIDVLTEKYQDAMGLIGTSLEDYQYKLQAESEIAGMSYGQMSDYVNTYKDKVIENMIALADNAEAQGVVNAQIEEYKTRISELTGGDKGGSGGGGGGGVSALTNAYDDGTLAAKRWHDQIQIGQDTLMNMYKEYDNYSEAIGRVIDDTGNATLENMTFTEKLQEVTDALNQSYGGVVERSDILQALRESTDGSTEAMDAALNAMLESSNQTEALNSVSDTLADTLLTRMLDADISVTEAVENLTDVTKVAGETATTTIEDTTVSAENLADGLGELSAEGISSMDNLADNIAENTAKMKSDIDGVAQSTRDLMKDLQNTAQYKDVIAAGGGAGGFHGGIANATGHIQGFAQGTRGVRGYYTQERGNELLVRSYGASQGRYTLLSDGDGVLPADLTRNLYDMARSPVLNALRQNANLAQQVLQGGPSGGGMAISIGDIHLSGVNDIDSFSKEIVNRLPSSIMQRLGKR